MSRKTIRQIWPAAVAMALVIAGIVTMRADWLAADDANVLVAGGALLAALASWAATSRASDTAEALALIERERWHRELTPQVEVEIRRPAAGERAWFRLKLVGPVGLDRLDSVVVTVRNDEVDRTPLTAPPPTAQDVMRQIWGPLQFTPGIDDVAEPGRETPAFVLERDDVKRFDMRNTRPPFWWTDETATARWRDEYRNQKVRLKIECRVDGHKPWYIYRELPVRSQWAEL
ncbi:hypothetical protein ACFYUJ_21215 [Streptomyces sp. NPDC004520]|uniref:hypothetical protein n=1 Tax=Streptomyces sp. NPDC004520 TaxID=3364702 RepID=UPI0036C1F71C